MVCIPCIILPVVLAIYLRFIQPFILYMLPTSWRVRVDTWLYPTCPVRLPPSSTVTNDGQVGDNMAQTSKATITVGGGNKKMD